MREKWQYRSTWAEVGAGTARFLVVYFYLYTFHASLIVLLINLCYAVYRIKHTKGAITWNPIVL